jgi:spermidine/putrescine transport system permease protein
LARPAATGGGAAAPPVGAVLRWRRSARALPALAPASLFYVAFFAVPMLSLFVLSFWRAKGFELVPDFSLVNYQKIAGSTLYRDILLRTLAIGLVTAVIVVPVAFALAYLMRFVFRRRGEVILQLILISLFSGYLVRIYAWRTILGKQGLLNSTLGWLGLIDKPLEFLIYSNFAVVVTLSGLLLPLAVLPIHSAMSNVARDYIEVAADLGSRRLHLLRTILVPMTLPGIRTAFAFTFLLAAGDFVTPALVGGMQSLMIGNVIADQFRGIGSNWPLGAALAFVTVAVVLVIHLALIRTIRWVTTW